VSRLLWLFVLLLHPTPAHAEWLCMPLNEFNQHMAHTGQSTTQLELTYGLTGVNPDDYFGTKGMIADLDDSSCAGVAGVALKVYGPDDPYNYNHPPGTLKQEYNDECCGLADCGEGWADPNASATIFVDGSEVCDVTIWLDPTNFGYTLVCNGTTYEGVGDNEYGLTIDGAAVLVGVDGTTWPMPNATSSNEQVCFEGVDDGVETLEFLAVEDVTAAVLYPSTVYPDEWDLSAGADDSEFFLKFAVDEIPGQVQSTRVHLHAYTESWSSGDGGDLYVVQDTGWSEDTLTWNSRPATTGGSLDRISSVTFDQPYSADVTSSVTCAGVYAFAFVPQASDTNGVHFFSKEGSASLGPRLRIEYIPGAGDDDDDDDDTAGDDDDVVGDDDDDDTNTDDDDSTPAAGDDDDGGSWESGCGCGVTTRPTAAAALLLLAVSVLYNRR
jgi:hypothetical protein